MRTLTLTSPPVAGDDVRALQTALAAKGWYRDELDGVYGPLTAQAVYRAKFWLGYQKPDQVAGDRLWAFLDGEKKQTPLMRSLTRVRMHPPAKPLRVKALEALTGKIGTKEHPAGSNRCWATAWYGMVGPWCAMAASWAYVQAGSKAFVRGQRYAYVPYIVADARAGRNNLTLTNDPQPGDLVCYDWERNGVADHVGLFEKWASESRDAFVAVEGNTSSDAAGDQSNGGEVCRKNRRRSQVIAFVHCGA